MHDFWLQATITRLVSEFGVYAFNLQQRGMGEVVFKHIDALDSIIAKQMNSPKLQIDLWCLFYPGVYDSDPTFLGVMVYLGLTRYVQHVLSRDPQLLKKPGRPLLSYSLRVRGSEPRGDFQAEFSDLIDMELVEFLLCHGADPNAIVPGVGESVFCEFADR
jgi:hypothetical protein